MQMDKVSVRHEMNLTSNHEDTKTQSFATKSFSLCFGGELFLEEISDDFHHTLDLCVGQFGINRQAQTFARGFFCHREITRLVAEAGVTFLQVQRQRIMQRAADAAGVEMFLQ